MHVESLSDWLVDSDASWSVSRSPSRDFVLDAELTDPDHIARNFEWSRDDDYLAVVSYDHNAYIYDDNYVLIDTLTDASDRVRSLDWSRDGDDLVIGSEDNTIYIYPVEELGDSPAPDTLTEPDARVNALRYHPDRDLMIATTNSPDGRVLVYDINDYSLTTSLDDQGYVYAGQWSPAGDYLAITGDEGTDTVDQVVVYDTSASDPDEWSVAFRDDSAHGLDWSVSSVEWSLDGGTLISAGQDGTIRFYDANDNFNVYRTLSDADGKVRVWRLRYSPDGEYLASGSTSLSIYNTSNYTIDLLERFEERQLGLAWSHDGATLATGGYDEKVTVYRYSDHS